MTNGDLNNTTAERARMEFEVDPAYHKRSFAISQAQDDAETRTRYRPFLLDEETSKNDWISQLELSTVLKMVENQGLSSGHDRLRVLVLHGSMRNRSYSRLLSYEASRILFRLGCDVRMYDPKGLPVKDDEQHSHPKVQELRELSKWSDGHIWISPEQHGNVTAVFKNQIDWIPLSTGSVRPTQGRTLAIAQVSGGSQSFNTVNTLRILGRWMRMFAIPNQSSVPMAYKQFTEPGDVEGGSRLMPSGNRDRIVDCMEEFVKYTLVMRPHFDLFGDRYSEREEKQRKAEQERLARAKEAVTAPDLTKIRALTMSKTVDDAIRIRDNQRRSRARRKDLIKDLQTRVQEFELKGVAATQDMQRAARKVAQENERLRTLLARHGILKEEVDSFLRLCERSESSIEPESRLSGPRNSSIANPFPINTGLRHIHPGPLTPAYPVYSPQPSPVQISRQHAQLSREPTKNSRQIEYSPRDPPQPSGLTNPCGSVTQCGPARRGSRSTEVETAVISRPVEAFRQVEGYYASPSETDSSPSRPQESQPVFTYSEHAPAITQSQGCCPSPKPQLEATIEDPECPSTADCFCPPTATAPPSTHTTSPGSDEISCETAATIIAQMRGDGDNAAARASIGCAPGQVCNIKNSFLMQVLDER
ncbi:hypothetical protein OPT61_g6139 [Boeremia exigua]|uniref:Uncharacterized protein n=1 Tax=Boeremia exigua TaxID=749465 RepID=A0ACC2I7T5_9PLEO|nr:hypothetical protein OPT61_g6139 [Boeremia exigua]